jgi:hypothetical protein
MQSAGSDSDLGAKVEGEIAPPKSAANDSSQGEYNTLDEPILLTIKRDASAVGNKLIYALVPNHKNLLMKDWDLWGPLFLCTYIGLMLQGIREDSGYQFTQLFVLVWVGAALLTYNLVFCSTATITMFQSVCVLGYCLGPMAVAATLFQLMHLFGITTSTLFLRLIIASAVATWAAMSSIKILGPTVPAEKKYVLLGPVAVFYMLIALLILYHSN